MLKLLARIDDQILAMIRSAALLALVFALLAPLAAQERHATVLLDGGRRIEGRVLSMNLKLLRIEVGNSVLKIPAAQIRSCRFDAVADPATSALPASDPAGKVATGDSPSAGQSAAGGGQPVGSSRKGSKISWTGPLQDPLDPTSPEAVPVDLRHRSLWHRRIELLDGVYPWLAPAAPSQWLSLGLLLLVGSGLIVHMSVHVAGGETPRLGRSVALGVWYLVTGLGQVAFVGVSDLSMAVMLLVNTSLSLFGLCALFGLPRAGAVVALMVQLGFGVLVFGILELVTALLGSVGVSL